MKLNKINPNLKVARTCYKHLAGNIAVTLAKNLIKQGYLNFDGQFHISNTGEKLFKVWGINLDDLKSQSLPLIKTCMDWTERKFHIGGLIGKAILNTFLNKDWLRKGNTHRTVYITAIGHQQLSKINLI